MSMLNQWIFFGMLNFEKIRILAHFRVVKPRYRIFVQTFINLGISVSYHNGEILQILKSRQQIDTGKIQIHNGNKSQYRPVWPDL